MSGFYNILKGLKQMNKLTNSEIVEFLRYNPHGVKNVDTSRLERYDITLLLIEQPSLINDLPVKVLDGFDFLHVLTKQPSLAEHLDLTLMTGFEKSILLEINPSMCNPLNCVAVSDFGIHKRTIFIDRDYPNVICMCRYTCSKEEAIRNVHLNQGAECCEADVAKIEECFKLLEA